MISGINPIHFKNQIEGSWKPVILWQGSGISIKIFKAKGSFVMHHHDEEDEFFQVLEGTLHMELKDTTLTLRTGECLWIPKGTNHRPFTVENEEALVLLVEPNTTVNTGNIRNNLTYIPKE